MTEKNQPNEQAYRDRMIENALADLPEPLTADELEAVLHSLIAAHLEDVERVPDFCFYFALKTAILWQQMEEREETTTH